MKKTYILGVTLLVLSVLWAGVANATVEMAQTSDFDSINGKKLIFYGEVIKSINISWRNYANHSQIITDNAMNINQSVFIYTIGPADTWNATYIEWGIIVTDINDTRYEFVGGFSTIEINQAKIQSMLDILKAKIIVELVNNTLYWNTMSETWGVYEKNITGSISDYIKTMTAELKSAGLNDDEISQLTGIVADAVKITREQEVQHNIALAKAEQKGWDYAFRLVGVFIGIIIIIVIVYLLVVKLKLPMLVKRIKPKGQKIHKQIKAQKSTQTSASSVLFGE